MSEDYVLELEHIIAGDGDAYIGLRGETVSYGRLDRRQICLDLAILHSGATLRGRQGVICFRRSCTAGKSSLFAITGSGSDVKLHTGGICTGEYRNVIVC